MNMGLDPLVIRASAGTGKTKRLTDRYLALLLRGERVERILATTFTKKAAFEIQERVLSRLLDAVEDQAKRKQLAEDVSLPDLELPQLQETLEYVFANLHRFQICTLDSFIARLVAAYSFEMGLPASWQIEFESEMQDIHRQALADVCTAVEPELLRSLVEVLARDRARRGVAFVLENSLQLLGDVYLESDIEAWEWARDRGSYFSDEFVESAVSDVAALELPKTKTRGTVPRHWGNAIDKLKSALQNRDHEAVLENSLLQRVVQGEAKFDRHEIDQAVVTVLNRVADAAGKVALLKLFDRTRTLHSLLGVYLDRLWELKTKAATFTFTDLKRLFENASIAEVLDEVYFRIDTQIAHILLDEFQDTSRHEWSVIEPLVAEVLSKAGGDNSFFCVGDVKQAIYGWRGGVAEIFDALQTKWPQIEQLDLDRSYRCSQTVLDFVNTVFHRAPETSVLSNFPVARETWQEQFHTHSAGVEQEGYVSVIEAPVAEIDSTFLAMRKDLDLILKTSADISIGVLVRKNSEVADVVSLVQEHFPEVSVSQEGGVSFSTYPIVSLLASFFELLDHPADSICWEHVRHTALVEVFGITLSDVYVKRCRSLSLLRKRLLAVGYQDFFIALIECLSKDCSALERVTLEKVCTIVRSFVPKTPERPSEFARWLLRQKDDDSKQAQVRVMTVHQSKGLEFDAVFLPALDVELKGRASKVADILREDPMQPPIAVCLKSSAHERSVIPELKAAEQYEENRRAAEALSLLYVAFTRARHALYLSLPPEIKTTRATYATLIREVLVGAEYPYCSGNAAWFSTVTIESKPIDNPILLPRTIAFKQSEALSSSVQFKTASGQEERFHSVRSILEMQLGGGVQRGLVAHEMLQHIGWVEDTSSIEVPTIAEHAEIYTEVCSALAEPEVASLFREETYRTAEVARVAVLNEKSFAFRDGDNLFSGSIDRLVLSYDTEGEIVSAQIVDFKTDRIASDEILKERIALYSPQIAVYKRAVACIFACPPERISACLLFLSLSKIVHLLNKE